MTAPMFTEPPRVLLPAIGFMMILGPVEEIGWRGFALPILQRRFVPFWAGLILGVIWAVWHLPAFLLSGTPQAAWDFMPFFAGSVACSVILTAFFNDARGSLLLAMLFHFQMNNPLWPDAQPYDLPGITVAIASPDGVISIAVGLADRERDRAMSPETRMLAASIGKTFVAATVLGTEPLFPAGAGWSYTDTGYLLLGLIIEDETSRPYYDEIQARFLGPLALISTGPSDRKALPGLARGYVSSAPRLGIAPSNNGRCRGHALGPWHRMGWRRVLLDFP